MATATHYSIKQLEQLWVQAGGDPKRKHLMAAIAMAESNGDPGAVNSKSGAIGLWQIHPGGTRYRDPRSNARAAVHKYNSQGLGAWEAYTNGSYKKYLGSGGGGGWRTAEWWATGGLAGHNPGGFAGDPAVPRPAQKVVQGAAGVATGGAIGTDPGSWLGGVENFIVKESVVALSYVTLVVAALALFVVGAMRATGSSPADLALRRGATGAIPY